MGKKPGAKVSFNETGLLRYVPCSADMRDVDFEEAAQGDAAFRKIFRHGKGLAKNPAEMANSPGSKINNRRMTTSFSSIHLKEGEGITYQIEHVMEEDDYIEPVPRNPGWEGDDDEILDELSGQFEVKVQLAPESAGITDRMLKCWIEPLNNSAKVLLGCKNTSCSVGTPTTQSIDIKQQSEYRSAHESFFKTCTVFKCHLEENNSCKLHTIASSTAKTDRQMSSLLYHLDIGPLDWFPSDPVAFKCPPKRFLRGTYSFTLHPCLERIDVISLGKL
mmetsp:Transcript_11646/g.13844  ORF Transcript_11646/g.13844 Transcript_11646/m.13844 type:complete len:276 (+) Transcript_11646:200-1027(+)